MLCRCCCKGKAHVTFPSWRYKQKMKMKFPTLSPSSYFTAGVGISLANVIIGKGYNPFVLVFFFLAGIIEFFARRQTKIPSVLISFFIPLAIVMFVKTSVIDFLKLHNSSLEPDIHKGAVVFYQPNFFSVKNDDLIIIKEFHGSRNILGKVLSIGEKSDNVEILSRKTSADVLKNNIAGKVIYITNNENRE